MTHKRCFEVPVDELPLGHIISASKKNDSLLKTLYGDWENEIPLSWYKQILRNEPENEENGGDCLEEDCGLHIWLNLKFH